MIALGYSIREWGNFWPLPWRRGGCCFLDLLAGSRVISDCEWVVVL